MTRVPSKTRLCLPRLSRLVDNVPGGFKREKKQERLWGLAFPYEFWDQLLQKGQLGFRRVEGLCLKDSGGRGRVLSISDRVRLGFC